MELWIRSQDKTNLILAKDIVVNNGDIKVYKDTELCTTVAMYKTEERALEILDEIQNILKPKYILDSSSIKPNGDSWVENGIVMQNYNANARIEELSIYVYEMPEE